MELLDVHPDSTDTMRFVANLLLQNYSSIYQNGYVILVGDGKRYKHLMNIKHLYVTVHAKKRYKSANIFEDFCGFSTYRTLLVPIKNFVRLAQCFEVVTTFIHCIQKH